MVMVTYTNKTHLLITGFKCYGYPHLSLSVDEHASSVTLRYLVMSRYFSYEHRRHRSSKPEKGDRNKNWCVCAYVWSLDICLLHDSKLVPL